MSNSRQIISNQTGIHDDLLQVVINHLETEYQRPIPIDASATFSEVKQKVDTMERSIILDSGCGVGQSTRLIAQQNPASWVIGVDQSAHRLDKSASAILPDNMILVRANLIDFWRLALADGWKLQKHYVLFPNPWPKKQHLKRRWYGHPVFPTLVNLKGELELRTNWKIYAEELYTVLDYMNFPVSEVTPYIPDQNSLTPFELKYQLSGHELYKVMANLM